MKKWVLIFTLAVLSWFQIPVVQAQNVHDYVDYPIFYGLPDGNLYWYIGSLEGWGAHRPGAPVEVVKYDPQYMPAATSVVVEVDWDGTIIDEDYLQYNQSTGGSSVSTGYRSDMIYAVDVDDLSQVQGFQSFQGNQIILNQIPGEKWQALINQKSYSLEMVYFPTEMISVYNGVNHRQVKVNNGLVFTEPGSTPIYLFNNAQGGLSVVIEDLESEQWVEYTSQDYLQIGPTEDTLLLNHEDYPEFTRHFYVVPAYTDDRGSFIEASVVLFFGPTFYQFGPAYGTGPIVGAGYEYIDLGNNRYGIDMYSSIGAGNFYNLYSKIIEVAEDGQSVIISLLGSDNGGYQLTAYRQDDISDVEVSRLMQVRDGIKSKDEIVSDLFRLFGQQAAIEKHQKILTDPSLLKEHQNVVVDDARVDWEEYREYRRKKQSRHDE